jgi:outer membrane lipoprotein SlyB
MKTRKQLFGLIAMAIIAIAIIALPLAGCKEDEPDPQPQEYPQKQPDTPRTLSFGTPACTVTIKSNDLFTTAEWKTLCDKVVAAIGRGYDEAATPTKTNIATYFANNTVSAVLLKSATYDVEVKSTVPNTMYLKANASTIDGISDDDMLSVITAMRLGSSYP